MTRTNLSFATRPLILAWTVVFVTTIAVMVLGCAQPTYAQQSGPRTFTSAAQASRALFDAVQKNDEQAVQAILGAGPELTSSGDDAQDKLEREHFAQKYQEMHRLVQEPDRTTVLYIGAENWPFPIPLVENNGKWHFDSDAGSQEVLARTVGENETTAIEVCHALGKSSAQRAAQTSGDDSIRRFADTITKAGTAQPVQGPFHGYYFRVLGQQPVGAVLVAYPATYGATGVMTFVVVGGGSIYEKDLGANTATLAQQIQGKPAGKWYPVQEAQTQFVAER